MNVVVKILEFFVQVIFPLSWFTWNGRCKLPYSF